MKRRVHDEALITYVYDGGSRVLSQTQANVTNPDNPVIVSSPQVSSFQFQASSTYDPHGDLIFSALDVNHNGVIDFSGPDRVTGHTTAYITKDDALWQESTQSVYPDFDSDRAVVTAKSRQKLTNLGAFSSVSEAEDIRGNVTTSTQTVDPGAGTTVSSTTVPTSVQPQVQIQRYGQLVESVSTTAVTNRYAYDGLNRRVSTTDGRDNTTTTAYNALGQVTYFEDPATNRTSYVYDQFGRQIETIDALNQSTYTAYDLRGNVVKQYGATYPVWYEYDVHGRMIKMATTRNTTLDPATVDSLDHPSLDVTRWSYDPATGLLVQKLYDDGKGPSYTYTPDGKLASRTWARGVVTEYAYDGAGELASVQYSDGTPPILKTYNRMGHPVSIISAGTTNIFEYSATTLEKISDTQLGYAIRHGNDNLGRMGTLSISNLYDGSYAYDAFGRMAEVSFEGLDFNYTYHTGSDRVGGVAYGTVEKTVSYEALRDLVTSISYHNTNGVLISERTYAYNALGSVISRTRQRGAEPVEMNAFDHNLRSELIAASLGGTNAISGDYGYAYDPIGNRVVATNRSDVTTYAANELNQYTNIIAGAAFTPVFDDDGNQTLVKTSTGICHVTYNAENRPVVWSNATAVVAMDYDFMGRRISKHLLSGEGETVDRLFLYDGYLQIAAIETNALVSTTFWDPTERIATRPLAMKTVGGVFTYTHDLTKNVMEVLDPGGDPVVVYDYDAFGAMTASRSYLNRFGFSSEYYDSDLGCIYYNYRHYNPLDGRWVSRDLIGETGGANLFAYSGKFVTVSTDRLGLQSMPMRYKKDCTVHLVISHGSAFTTKFDLSTSKEGKGCRYLAPIFCSSGYWAEFNRPLSDLWVPDGFPLSYGLIGSPDKFDPEADYSLWNGGLGASLGNNEGYQYFLNAFNSAANFVKSRCPSDELRKKVEDEGVECCDEYRKKASGSQSGWLAHDEASYACCQCPEINLSVRLYDDATGGTFYNWSHPGFHADFHPLFDNMQSIFDTLTATYNCKTKSWDLAGDKPLLDLINK